MVTSGGKSEQPVDMLNGGVRMTVEETIKKITERHCTEGEHCTDNCMNGDEFCEYSLAIEALEKQIPKKPYIQQDDRNNDCIECPFCDSFIGYEYDCRDEHYQINYCPCCGQSIDWSEEE